MFFFQKLQENLFFQEKIICIRTLAEEYAYKIQVAFLKNS